MLRIRSEDTIGFLYELANALALAGIDIVRLIVASSGHSVFDTLHVTDAMGEKITDPDRQRELRAAIVLIKHFTHLLPRSPNPEAALLHFRDFLEHLFQQPELAARAGLAGTLRRAGRAGHAAWASAISFGKTFCGCSTSICSPS